jgi:hypothetical protein
MADWRTRKRLTAPRARLLARQLLDDAKRLRAAV